MRDAMNPPLRVRNLSVFYGKICAVRSLSFDVNTGEIITLVNPNSTKKTNTMLTIASHAPFQRVTNAIKVDTKPITNLATTTRLTQKVHLMPQKHEIFPTLTVEDNLRVVAEHLGLEWEDALARSRTLFPRVFVERRRSLAGNLSGDEQQMLALARALLNAPKILLLNKPSLKLTHKIVSQLARVINNLHSQDIAVLLADQSVTPWKEIADRICVMVRGSILATVGHADEVERLLGVG